MSEKAQAFQEELQAQPVIAAVKHTEGLEHALRSECAAVFILFGSILDIPELTERVREAGKYALVHLDLVEGMTGKDISVDYLAQKTAADGILSTRPALIRRAGELGLISIQRFFLLDSLSLENVLQQGSSADFVDVLPGAMPKVLRRLTAAAEGRLRQSIIASGLLTEKADVLAALSAGALAVSTTSENLWFA